MSYFNLAYSLLITLTLALLCSQQESDWNNHLRCITMDILCTATRARFFKKNERTGSKHESKISNH